MYIIKVVILVFVIDNLDNVKLKDKMKLIEKIVRENWYKIKLELE